MKDPVNMKKSKAQEREDRMSHVSEKAGGAGPLNTTSCHKKLPKKQTGEMAEQFCRGPRPSSQHSHQATHNCT